MKKVFTIVSALMLTLSANALSIKVGLETITTDKTYTISEYEEPEEGEIAEYEFSGTITSTTGTIQLDVTRSEVAEVIDEFELPYYDTFCFGAQCIQGNGELTQSATYSNLQGNVLLHITCPVVDGKTFTYNYKFTDGSESLTLTLIYTTQAEAISAAREDVRRSGVYTIFGQQLREDNSTEGLPTGMYIVAGKKVIIK